MHCKPIVTNIDRTTLFLRGVSCWVAGLILCVFLADTFCVSIEDASDSDVEEIMRRGESETGECRPMGTSHLALWGYDAWFLNLETAVPCDRPESSIPWSALSDGWFLPLRI
jgi:hypothetical protein